MPQDEYLSSTTQGEQAVWIPAQETLTPQNRPASLSSASHKGPAMPSPIAPSAYAVEFHIEELVLHGFAASDRRRIGESFETEMHRLFSDCDVPSSMIRGGEITLPNDLAFNLTPSAPPEAIGTQIARVIFRSISR